MKRDKFRCRLCKDDETELQVHHKEYIFGNEPWEYENELLVTLCSHCHEEIERLKKELGELDFSKIKIYKSNNWTGGSRIMFVSYLDKCIMGIYDDDGEYLIGYNLTGRVLSNIIKILKQTSNG